MKYSSFDSFQPFKNVKRLQATHRSKSNGISISGVRETPPFWTVDPGGQVSRRRASAEPGGERQGGERRGSRHQDLPPSLPGVHKWKQEASQTLALTMPLREEAWTTLSLWLWCLTGAPSPTLSSRGTGMSVAWLVPKTPEDRLWPWRNSPSALAAVFQRLRPAASLSPPATAPLTLAHRPEFPSNSAGSRPCAQPRSVFLGE